MLSYDTVPHPLPRGTTAKVIKLSTPMLDPFSMEVMHTGDLALLVTIPDRGQFATDWSNEVLGGDPHICAKCERFVDSASSLDTEDEGAGMYIFRNSSLALCMGCVPDDVTPSGFRRPMLFDRLFELNAFDRSLAERLHKSQVRLDEPVVSRNDMRHKQTHALNQFNTAMFDAQKALERLALEGLPYADEQRWSPGPHDPGYGECGACDRLGGKPDPA